MQRWMLASAFSGGLCWQLLDANLLRIPTQLPAFP
jgi:hypothetical protein